MGAIARRRYRVQGTVQGVGFRPFVYRSARRHGLTGYVLNDGDGVVVEAEGTLEELDDFLVSLRRDAPPLAAVTSVTVDAVPPAGSADFEVAASAGTGATAVVPPDIATCPDCLRELFDPADRRYRYPFLNCTNCGPRLTIVRTVPYDRASTTMAQFAMCPACRAEYEDPGDRRFHAEPTCCPECGPQLSMPLDEAVTLLAEGRIVAVKGLGGYHLACDATNEAAVARLRARKQRDDKPFALMTGDPEAIADVPPEAAALLRSPAHPIVLLRAKHDAVAGGVAPGSPWLGVMLPYTPLHHLLWHDLQRPLVLTSGNIADEPIAFDDGDAQARLGEIADAFLAHDRPIHRRCEDSVVRVEFPIRRSRGYAPSPLTLPRADEPVLAVGAELKSTFCVARDGEAYLSPHLGDLDCDAAYRAFEGDIDLYLQMLNVHPARIAHDLHPEYLSTKWALEQDDVELVPVQHHHAHAAACLAEHGLAGPALALVFDGTGLGTDGTLWGGELLLADLKHFERLAWLDPIPLPGGEAAVRQPWRLAAAYLERAGRPVPWERWALVREALKLDPPRTSGMGRLFDAVAALLGVRDEITYEGQAAIELELLAGDVPATPYSWRFGDGASLVALIHDDLHAGRDRRELAAAFHETIAAAAADACAHVGGPQAVVLSGGTFQNLRLLESTRRRLTAHGFTVLTHRIVPPNDGGISYGQAAVACA